MMGIKINASDIYGMLLIGAAITPESVLAVVVATALRTSLSA